MNAKICHERLRFFQGKRAFKGRRAGLLLLLFKRCIDRRGRSGGGDLGLLVQNRVVEKQAMNKITLAVDGQIAIAGNAV